MNNNYEIVKNIEKLKNGNYTKFLDTRMQLEIKKRLKKDEYKIYYPYSEAEKVIFYKDFEPKISLLEIISSEKLEHRDILGSMFSLGLDQSVFGDIILYNGKYYVYVLEDIKEYIINNLTNIKKSSVFLEERNIDELKNFKRQYEEIEIISSSERIDTVISHLISVNRNKIKDLIKDKDILLNYEVVQNSSKKLQNNDILSIRKYGKYRYIGIYKTTKGGNLIIKVNKYI